jgi:hypothetical protein
MDHRRFLDTLDTVRQYGNTIGQARNRKLSRQ